MASTTTRRTTTTRKRATPAVRRPVAGEPAAFEPIRIPANEDVPDDRVPLFFIGEEEFTVPSRVPVGIALEYLRVAREQGQELATGALLSRALGEDAYRALESARGLTEEQLNDIVQRVLDLSMGRAQIEGKASA